MTQLHLHTFMQMSRSIQRMESYLWMCIGLFNISNLLQLIWGIYFCLYFSCSLFFLSIYFQIKESLFISETRYLKLLTIFKMYILSLYNVLFKIKMFLFPISYKAPKKLEITKIKKS